MKNYNKELPVTVNFEGVTERDMDFLLMRKLSCDIEFLEQFFLSQTRYSKHEIDSINVSHSVVTEDGETDIEVIVTTKEQNKFALLIEDKVDAPAMDKQADRYLIRGEKAKLSGKYDDYFVFIVAPEKYLQTNAEASKYDNKISYESIRDSFTDPFDIAVINKAIKGYGGVTLTRNQYVTDFWDKVYDFADQYYKGEFKIQGKRGLPRSGIAGQWITISCNDRIGIQIKSDRGYVDLEIKNYADQFEDFCKDNKQLIEDKRLFIRTATKSLAIRYYTMPIDFTMPFESQKPALRSNFDAAKELQKLIPMIKVR